MAKKNGKLAAVVKELADAMLFNWTRAPDERTTADRALMVMAKHGLIRHREHKHGGHVWIVGRQKFGRTD